MLSFRVCRVFQSKALVTLASAFGDRLVHSSSRSHLTPAYLEELEGLYKYTRGRWLCNEREREYLVYAVISYSSRRVLLQRMIFVTRHSIMKSSRKSHVRL